MDTVHGYIIRIYIQISTVSTYSYSDQHLNPEY